MNAASKTTPQQAQGRRFYAKRIKGSISSQKTQCFTTPEQPPQFPGGEAALLKWIKSHLIYPKAALEKHIEGRVVVQFVVTNTGNVGDVKVVRSVDRDLDNEAVRVCKTLPKFRPGRHNGQPVNVWYTLPIMFRL